MAFRIHDSVVRGEIDNRVKGTVRGKIWLEGRADPVVLELKGNARSDLAGCLLTFINPLPCVPHHQLHTLQPIQRGGVGDMTASSKVRVFDVPAEEAFDMIDRGEKPPEHLANSLYLEWFSEGNGRVVIESADYKLTISAPEWQMTDEDLKQRARDAAAGFNSLKKKLTDAIETLQRAQKEPEEKWDEHDYEKLLKESDARTDKYMELLDKYGHSPEAEEKIAEEMGWNRELTPEEAEEEGLHIDEINRAGEEALNEPEPEPDPAREGIDWVRDENGHLRHPLQHRSLESFLKFWHLLDKTGDGLLEDDAVAQFLAGLQIASTKLAGALAGVAEGRNLADASFTVAYLKRALDNIHQSQSGLEAAAGRSLLPEAIVTEARAELFAIREGILRLMDEYRGRH